MTLANGSVIDVTGVSLPRLGYEAGAGLTIAAAKVDLTIAYIGRFRSDYVDNTGTLTLKYRF
jgi:hypothetical protein